MAQNGGTNFGSGYGPVEPFLTNTSGNVILARCASVTNLPTGAGYAIGCEIQVNDSGATYINNGSASSAAWTRNNTGVVSAATITALGTAQNSTPTIAQLLGGVVTQGSTGATGTVTLPLGTLISAGVPGTVTGTSFQTLFSNLGGGQVLTITGATGSTVVGSANVSSATNAILEFVNTGTNTWNVYVK